MAIEHCANDQKCTGVYDKLCDEQGPFKLCLSSIFEDRSLAYDCSYNKILGKTRKKLVILS